MILSVELSSDVDEEDLSRFLDDYSVLVNNYRHVLKGTGADYGDDLEAFKLHRAVVKKVARMMGRSRGAGPWPR